MGEQRYEIEFARLCRPFAPELGEIGYAFIQMLHAPLHVGADNADRIACCGDIRPEWQLVAVLEGKVEQCRQHLGGQFD